MKILDRKVAKIMKFSVFRPVKRGFRFLVDRHFQENTTIHGRYQVKSILGSGSYGTTYLCKDAVTDSHCVLKQMTKSKRKKRMEFQYNQETKILEQLSHPSIPQFYERFCFQNTCFFSMQYMEGQNLEDALFFDEQKFSEKDSLLLLEKVIGVLDYLHSLGVAHGDLRIPNIILKEEQLSIIDFGLAKTFSHLPESVIHNSSILKNDFFDAGDVLLFLLYSTYTPTGKKGRPWTEELTLKPSTSHLLKRLLGMEKPYSHTKEVLADIKHAINETAGRISY